MHSCTCVIGSHALSPLNGLCMLQMMSLGLDTASLGGERSPEAVHEMSQQQRAWANIRAQAVEEGSLETERERLQVWHTARCRARYDSMHAAQESICLRHKAAWHSSRTPDSTFCFAARPTFSSHA